MSSVKFELDSLMVLRILQVMLVMEIYNLGYQLQERAGLYIINGMLVTYQTGLLALGEFGLLIMILAMKPSWKFAVNLYTTFMIGVEIIWFISLLLGTPWYFGYATFALLLILFRAAALIRLNYITSN